MPEIAVGRLLSDELDGVPNDVVDVPVAVMDGVLDDVAD